MTGYQVDAYGQFITAVISAAAGVGLCLLYDLLRLIRYARRHTTLQVFVQDLLWWIAATVVTWVVLLVRCSGTVRFFALLGLTVGFLSCRFTLSLVLMKLGKKVIDAVKTVLKVVWRAVFEPFFRWVRAVWDKFSKIIKKFLKSVKNLLKDSMLVVYNHFVLWAEKPRQKEQ
ncbi:MAG: hypothetical protein IJF58_03520 [Clostridia bacterium]|nr:hypothetical protein [Clostridia bacterium]